MKAWRLWAGLGVLACAPAWAQQEAPVWVQAERPDLVGLSLGLGGSTLAEARGAGQGGFGGRFLLEAGASYQRADSSLALVAAARLGLGGPQPEVGVHVGARSLFGREGFRTFAELDVAARFTPALTLGPRVAFGAQYELTPALALYASAGLQLAFLQGLRGDLELTGGLVGLFDVLGG